MLVKNVWEFPWFCHSPHPPVPAKMDQQHKKPPTANPRKIRYPKIIMCNILLCMVIHELECNVPIVTFGTEHEQIIHDFIGCPLCPGTCRTSRKSKVPRTVITVVLLSSLGFFSFRQGGQLKRHQWGFQLFQQAQTNITETGASTNTNNGQVKTWYIYSWSDQIFGLAL